MGGTRLMARLCLQWEQPAGTGGPGTLGMVRGLVLEHSTRLKQGTGKRNVEQDAKNRENGRHSVLLGPGWGLGKRERRTGRT